ncbi:MULTISPECIES: branched-chain amino acid aminotransferase [unclassified Oscillibacter]|uniref:branched-chain amino acid aminotransferase n=1 Tax=unclassified Oscillibacter TaxID=2629304 RepID=UPI0025F753ED|nr:MULTISPECIES: branched-chain amino acid aminotransferase [unclassified Oscillibacter]
MLNIKITKTTSPKAKPADESKLGFGKTFSDHMFIMDYTEGQGWHDARIVPYAPISLEPSAVVFHYAQECFEGLKAYRTAENKIQLFRPDCNARRMNNTQERLCMPSIPEEDFVEATRALVEVEKDWVPHSEGASLYIRPFTIATMAQLGVHASTTYQFIIICAPSGAYYAAGLAPIDIYVEDTYVRACPGGTGFTKCGGNYAVSLLAAKVAEERGYSQVLWLDGVERKYVEEVGAMNIFFKIDGKLYTAEAQDRDGTVLPGVTRRSIIELLKDWGYEVVEGKLAVDDLMKASREGKLEEVFGTGTAAVVSPVKKLDYEDQTAQIGHGEIGPLTQKLYDTLTGIQWGRIPDTKGWIVPVCDA